MSNGVKFHISPMTGEPRKCMAGKRPCPVGDDAPHFDSKEEAYNYIESRNADKLTKTFNKSDKEKNIEQKSNKENDSYGVKLYPYKEIKKFSHGTVYTDGERYYTFINIDGRKSVNINDVIIKHQESPLIHSNSLSKPKYIKLFDPSLSNEEQFMEDNYVPISVQKFNASTRLADAYPVGTIFKKDGFQYRVTNNDFDNLQVMRELNYDNNKEHLYPSSELLNGAEIIHKPDIMTPLHKEFREKFSPGSIMEIKRVALEEKRERRNLKTFFGLKKSDKLPENYDQEMRVRVMENDGTFIKFRNLNTNKVSELLRDDFKKKYQTAGTVHTQPYLNPYELKEHLAEQLQKNKSYDLYDDNGRRTIVKVKELKYNSVVFTYTEKDHSVPDEMEISNRDLTNGEYSFTNHIGITNNSSISNIKTSANNLPYGNLYQGDYTNKVTDPMKKLQSNDYVTIVDSQGFILSSASKVVNNDNKELILEDFSRGTKYSYSNESIENSRLTFLKL